MASENSDSTSKQSDSFEDYLDKATTMRLGSTTQPTLALLDQYEIVRRLGGGGFGAVYLARDTEAKIDVAIKGLPPFISGSADELGRIRDNFALVSRLHHPHIAAVLHLQRLKSALYCDKTVQEDLRVAVGDLLMVMVFAPGLTIAQWRQQFPDRRIPAAQVIQVAEQIAQALDYAHGEHVLHRDIKPSNIIVEQKPDGSITARLIDFGLATEMGSDRANAVSGMDADMDGTWPFMAPEQWNREGLCAATDQYGLAVLLCYLFTGTVPFASAFKTRDASTIKTAVCTRPLELPASCPCRSAFKRALSRIPSTRFDSCAEFVEAVKHGLRNHVKTVAAVAGGAVLAGVLATVGILWLGSPTSNTERSVPAPKPEPPVVQPAPRPAPKPKPPVVQPAPRPAPKPKPPKVKHSLEIKILQEEAEKAQKEAARKELQHQLDLRMTGINRIKKIARDNHEKALPFRNDTAGLENHLRRFDDKFNAIVNSAVPQTAEEADAVLGSVKTAINDMLDELKWLEDNSSNPSRMKAKSLFQEIEGGVLSKCRDLKALGFGHPSHDEGEKLLSAAKKEFEAGNFLVTLDSLQRAQNKLDAASRQQSSNRLNWLVSRVKSCYAAGDWDGCIQAAEAVMIIDRMNLEVELLLDEARSKRASAGH